MTAPGYMLCTAPRSGSTLLCRMLAGTGVAGDPESLFYAPDLADWTDRFDLPRGAPMAEILAAARRMGRGNTPVFALRQQRHSFAFLCNRLAETFPEAPSDQDRLTRAFGPLRFLHLTRADKLAQAVSLVKARQSGLWHRAADGSEWERSAAHREPVYDGQAIAGTIALLTGYDRDWNSWFAAEGITPLRLDYDGLSANPPGTLREVLAFLDLDPALADQARPGLSKMTDATSADWIARFRAEHRAG